MASAQSFFGRGDFSQRRSTGPKYPRVTMQNSAVVGALRNFAKAALPHTYAAVTGTKPPRASRRKGSKAKAASSRSSFFARGNVPSSAPATARRSVAAPPVSRGIFSSLAAKSARHNFKADYAAHKYNRAMAKTYSTKGMNLNAGQRGFIGLLRGIEHMTRRGKAPKGYDPNYGRKSSSTPVAPKRLPLDAQRVRTPAQMASDQAFFKSAAGKAFNQQNRDFNNVGRTFKENRAYTPNLTLNTASSIEAELHGYQQKAIETRKRKAQAKRERKQAKALRDRERAAKKAAPKAQSIGQKVKTKQAQLSRTSGRPVGKSAPRKKVKGSGGSIEAKVKQKQSVQRKSMAKAAKAAAPKAKPVTGHRKKGAATKKHNTTGFYQRLDPRTGKKIKVKLTKRGQGKKRSGGRPPRRRHR